MNQPIYDPTEDMESLPRLNDADLEKLSEHIQGLLEQFETLPYPKVQSDVFELLNCIDHLHREALTRLVHLIEAKAEHIKLDMANDFAIQMLMMLYNFVPDEELPPAAQPNHSGTPLIGLDQIAIQPLEEIKRPVWIPALTLDELAVGAMLGRKVEGVDLVICRPSEEEITVFQNACIDSILPLDRGTVEEGMIVCPWHGCHYEMRTGIIQNGSGLRLTGFPVQISGDGNVRIGFNVPEWMQ